jgi:hypothetical protein
MVASSGDFDRTFDVLLTVNLVPAGFATHEIDDLA